MWWDRCRCRSWMGDIEGRAADLTEEAAGVTLVVGTSSTVVGSDETFWQAVSWTVTRTDSGLTVTGPAVFAGANFWGGAGGVNNFGDAVGGAALQESQVVPFVRIAGQPMVALPLLPNGHSGRAQSINDSGQIVGSPIHFSATPNVGTESDIVDKFHHRGGSEQPGKVRQGREAGHGVGHQPSNPARRHTRP